MRVRKMNALWHKEKLDLEKKRKPLHRDPRFATTGPEMPWAIGNQELWVNALW